MVSQKTLLSAAIGVALGGISFSSSAALTSSATLDFTLGAPGVVACTYGTTPPCNKASYEITDIVGSYFTMDTNGDGVATVDEKTPIGSFNGLHIGSTQWASGSHSGSINGTENPNIDAPWTFFGNTGMHQTTAPTSVASTGTDGSGNMTAVLNLAWSVTWNGLTNIPMIPTSDVTIVCDSATCSDGSNYTLDGAYHVAGAGFTSVGYTVHLEGTITNAPSTIPVPAAAWLFGSGLMGLAGVARRRKSIK